MRGISYNTVSKLGTIPLPPYRVAYQLDPKGRFTVVKGGSDYMAVKESGWAYTVAICFLPEAWLGQRVTREIIK
jgi:hypothetical protein